MTFKRTDFLETFLQDVDVTLDMHLDYHAYIFNICEDNSKPYVVYLETLLKNSIENLNKEEISIVDIKQVNWLDLSNLPRLSIIDCSNLSNHDIGVISSQEKKLRASKNVFLFNFTKKQHSDLILNSFEPFQLRTRSFNDLSKDLETFQDFFEIHSSIKNKNISSKRNKL